MPRSNRHGRFIVDTVVMIAGIVTLAVPAKAGLMQSDITSPGGFVQAGATDIDSTNGGGIIPGADLEGQFASPNAVFNEQSFSGNTSATTSAFFSSPSITNSATTTASLGQIKLFADNANGINSGAFPGGRAHGGYKDTLTLMSPGLNGLLGFYVFTVNVSGTLSATGPNGLASLRTSVYKDDFEVLQNGFWDQGNSDVIIVSAQQALWGAATFPSDLSEFETVSDTITMSVPMIFGTPLLRLSEIWKLPRRGSRLTRKRF